MDGQRIDRVLITRKTAPKAVAVRPHGRKSASPNRSLSPASFRPSAIALSDFNEYADSLA